MHQSIPLADEPKTRFHLAAPDILRRSFPSPSTSASSVSPGLTAATPSGVPLKIRSPGFSSKYVERCSIISATFQIILHKTQKSHTDPNTNRQNAPFVINSVSETR